MPEADAVVLELRQLSLIESDDPISARRALVARRLTSLIDTPDDVVRYGLTQDRLRAMLGKRRTLAFGADAQQSEFGNELRDSMRRHRLVGALRIIGTSTTLFSLNPDKPASHYFDASSNLSDIDIGLECPNLASIAAKVGVDPRKSKLNPAGSFAREQLAVALPEAEEIIRDWEVTLGRTIQIGAPADGKSTPFAWITDYVLPFG